MAETPQGIENDVTYFARTNFRDSSRLFGIKRRDRRQHSYVIGKTGTGKSAMLNNMIVQDIANGEGVCVVDPHGELVEGILEKIPEERMKDVVYFNPADPDYHIGFNILELPDTQYKHLVASGLMAIFTKIWSGVWSPRMEYILNNCILALLDTPHSTLLGIPRLLTDKAYRQQVVANVQDPVVRAFWTNEFESWQDRFRNEAIAPIQNKVGQFLSTSLVRNIVGQPKSTIDIFDIMNQGKIFLVNVSKGRIGEDNSALLGAMLITKIQLAAMERVRIPEQDRVDFYLYVDEFQNFATDSFAGILSEARKYRLNLTLAHQYVGQLVTETSTRVRDAIFGNVGTMIIFRVGAADAEFLENEFTPEFTIEDIVNLPNYHIYIKLMVDGVTARPFSAITLPPFKVQTSASAKQDIITMSRRYYARPREVIEAEIEQWSTPTRSSPSAPSPIVPTVNSSFGSGRSPQTAPTQKKSSSAAAPQASIAASGVRYEAVCSSCGTLTSLPFEPTPGRPVYCRDCMKKIESGEIKPIRWRPTQPSAPGKPTKSHAATHTSKAPLNVAEDEPSSVLSLEDTSSSSNSSPQPPHRESRAPKEVQEIPKTQKITSAQTLSLSDLAKPHEKNGSHTKRAPREETDIASLREAIRASLRNDIAPGAISSDVDNTHTRESVKVDDEDNDESYEKDRSSRYH